jgi:hypothetical protein
MERFESGLQNGQQMKQQSKAHFARKRAQLARVIEDIMTSTRTVVEVECSW